MNKELAMSELNMLKTALTLGLQRIDSLMNYVDGWEGPEVSRSHAPYRANKPTQREIKYSEESYSVESMFEDMFSIADAMGSKFDRTFIDSIYAGFEKYGKLTDKQLSALTTIHMRFNKGKYP